MGSINVVSIERFVRDDMEIERNAYNVAFSELGLAWYWDETTYAQLRAAAKERCHVRSYLEAHQPHLLSAYDAEFLVRAIESKRDEAACALRESRPTAPARLDLPVRAEDFPVRAQYLPVRVEDLPVRAQDFPVRAELVEAQRVPPQALRQAQGERSVSRCERSVSR